MERLTFEGNFCDIAQCQELPCQHGNSCSQRKVWERLKAYEDTGLSPTACATARVFEDGLNAADYSISRIVELMNADKDGRVVVLPCKVGDELWTFSDYPRGKVYSAQVTDVSTLNGKTIINVKDFEPFSSRDVGRTMFLTREEEEKALEARKDG